MKRLAIYVYHDKTGVIGGYALYFLNALQEIAQDIVVILNGQIKIEELEKFKNFKGRIIQRENKGYDFWGWREGIFSVGIEKLKEYDELILTNSSTFGPLFPFKDVFSKVKPADFWGITSHAPTAKIKEHIQSYFMVFKNKMFTSKD
ncbi:MAG: rhamnan synthesis F family protein, partial [Candidatus Gastranaerophilales bacterium]|nr:rhamnan synthesis F family protein [Candidatus Gastranaerophilales bacterium]